MKIAVLSGHTPSIFWFRMDMMRAFIELGHEVVAIGDEPEEKWKEKFETAGIKYISAEICRTGTNPARDIQTFFSLLRILKEEKPDKIFTYQAKTVIYGAMAARAVGISEIYPLIAGVGSVFLSAGKKNKIIAFILKTEYRFALKKCKTVFFQNADDVSLYEAMKIVKKDNVVILNGSGVNLNNFQVKPLPERTAFLCISRLIKDKGVIEYLEAAKKIKLRFPDVEFMLVGPFDTNPSAISKTELQAYIDSGVINYYGEQEDVRPYIEKCTVFVLPSYREGTPKTVLEAMAVGRAIITTDAPGCRETVKDGVNGYLVPVRDVNAIVDKMTYLIQNRNIVCEMANKGRRMVEDKFDVVKVNEKIIASMKI